MIAFIIYLAGLCENLQCLIMILTLSSLVFCLCFIAFDEMERHHTHKLEKLKKISPINIISCHVFLMVFTCFIPSEKTVYLMLGASHADGLLKSDEAKKVRAIINKKLDEFIKESEIKK